MHHTICPWLSLANNIWCLQISTAIILFYLYLPRNCMRRASISHYQHRQIDYKYLHKKIMKYVNLKSKEIILNYGYCLYFSHESTHHYLIWNSPLLFVLKTNINFGLYASFLFPGFYILLVIFVECLGRWSLTWYLHINYCFKG